MALNLRCRSPLGAFVRTPLGAFGCASECPLCLSTPQAIALAVLGIGEFWTSVAGSNGYPAAGTLVGSDGEFFVDYVGFTGEGESLYCYWTFDGSTTWQVSVQEYEEGVPVGSPTVVSINSIHVEVRRYADRWEYEGQVEFTYNGVTYTRSAFSGSISADPNDCVGTFGPQDNTAAGDHGIWIGTGGSTTLAA